MLHCAELQCTVPVGLPGCSPAVCCLPHHQQQRSTQQQPAITPCRRSSPLVSRSLAIPLHFSFLKHLLNSTSCVCEGAALQTPAARWLLHGTFELLDLPRRAIAPPNWEVVAVPPHLECEAVMSCIQASREGWCAEVHPGKAGG